MTILTSRSDDSTTTRGRKARHLEQEPKSTLLATLISFRTKVLTDVPRYCRIDTHCANLNTN